MIFYLGQMKNTNQWHLDAWEILIVIDFVKQFRFVSWALGGIKHKTPKILKKEIDGSVNSIPSIVDKRETLIVEDVTFEHSKTDFADEFENLEEAFYLLHIWLCRKQTFLIGGNI